MSWAECGLPRSGPGRTGTGRDGGDGRGQLTSSLKDMQGEFTESQKALVKDLAVNPMPTESGAGGGAAAHAAASAGSTTSAAGASATPSEATDSPKVESASRRVGASLAVAAVAVVAGLALF